MSVVKRTPGALRVVGPSRADPRQFEIRNTNYKGEWDDIYVSVSGFFGSYGPHVFAAAPDMLAALKAVDALGMLNPTGSGTVEDAARAVKTAIAKAEGQS